MCDEKELPTYLPLDQKKKFLVTFASRMNADVLAVFERFETILIASAAAVPETSAAAVAVIEPMVNLEFAAFPVVSWHRTNFA